MTLDQLIKACQINDPKAQKELYDRYKDVLFAIARRYIKDHQMAEDLFVSGMHRILTKIDSYKFNGSFEGWMKRIVVNECLMYLRKPINKIHQIEIVERDAVEYENALQKLETDDILKLINQLPDGYRTVFNLYIIEGYKHREIAEKLGISINTSKSQLLLAKRKMQKLIKEHYDE